MKDLNKEQFINRVSKIDQTEEDEFRAEYNSPELIYPVFQEYGQKRASEMQDHWFEFIKWYSGMEEHKILKAYERWKRETKVATVPEI